MSETKYAYSRNAHEGPWTTDIDDFLYELKRDNDLKSGDSVRVFRAEVQDVTHSDFVPGIGEFVREALQEWAYDNCGEYAETYLEDMNKEQEAEIDALILAYLDKNVPQPLFWNVTNITGYEVRIP